MPVKDPVKVCIHLKYTCTESFGGVFSQSVRERERVHTCMDERECTHVWMRECTHVWMRESAHMYG